MKTENKTVVREFLFNEDDGYATASVAGTIEEWTSGDDRWYDIQFRLHDGVDDVSLDFSVTAGGDPTAAIRAKKTLDKVACVLRTLREKLNEIAYPEEPK